MAGWARMQKVGLKRVTTVVYPTMRHETLNEIERDSAMQDFAGWCLSVAEQRK